MYQLAIDLAASILFAVVFHAQSSTSGKVTAMAAFVISFSVLTLRPFIAAFLKKRVTSR